MFLQLTITISTVFIIDKQLVNCVVFGKYFWFFGSMGLVGILTVISVIYSVFKKLSFHISPTDYFVVFFIVSVFFTTLVLNDSYANMTKLTVTALLFVLYISLRMITESNQHKQILCFFIMITGLVEAVCGLMQLYGFRTSQHSLFKLTGSFFNPGPYAGYLSVVLQVALYCFLKNYRHTLIKEVSIDAMKNGIKSFNMQPIEYLIKWLSGITVIVIVLVLPASMSRASWLAAITGSIVVIVGKFHMNGISNLLRRRFRTFSNRIIACLLVISLLIVTFAGMYYLKKDSADGRLLMWKVSLSAVAQHPLGVGLGHFPSAYGEAQAAYFASGNATEAEEYVAGNPEYGFNELLQIAIESGIVALMLFIGMLACAFRGVIKQKNWGVMGALVALLVFACFSYPFSVLPFLIVFVFLLAVSGGTKMTQIRGINADFSFLRSIRNVVISVCCLMVTAFCIWRQYSVNGAYKQWKNHQMYYQAGMYREVVQNYEPLYPYLNDQIKFLFEYGRSLSQLEQPERSNDVLLHAMQISCDPMLYNIMGKNYQAMKRHDLAEENFRKSALIVPNRIYPYYLLMKLYIETGDKEQALENAHIVLTKEPKVMSTAIREMREEARLIGN